MNNLNVLTRDQVSAETRGMFDALQQKMGMVPNLYAVAGASYPGLKALLDLGGTLASGEFSAQEVEAVALAIAEENGCEYCLAAHTAVGKMLGFSEAQTFKLRNATIENPKLSALTALAKAIVRKRGWPEQARIDTFFAVGYRQAALVELVGLVALNTFTNYLNHIADTPIDFPAARLPVGDTAG